MTTNLSLVEWFYVVAASSGIYTILVYLLLRWRWSREDEKDPAQSMSSFIRDRLRAEQATRFCVPPQQLPDAVLESELASYRKTPIETMPTAVLIAELARRDELQVMGLDRDAIHALRLAYMRRGGRMPITAQSVKDLYGDGKRFMRDKEGD